LPICSSSTANPLKNLKLFQNQGQHLSVIMKGGRFHKNRLPVKAADVPTNPVQEFPNCSNLVRELRGGYQLLVGAIRSSNSADRRSRCPMLMSSTAQAHIDCRD